MENRKPKKYKEDIIKSFEDYLSKVEQNSEDKNITYLYRGQRVADWSLLPSLSRRQNNEDVLDVEKKIIKEFKRRSFPFLPPSFNNESTLDVLALAQHFKLPTRLLDWTENPLTALWFAFEDKLDTNSNPPKDRAVWLLKAKEEYFVDRENPGNPLDYDGTKIFKPNQITQRIISQSGWFTLHYFDNNTGQFNPLEENNKYDADMVKLIISDGLRNEMLTRLEKFGINAYYIYPDLEGLSRYLDWKHFYK